MNNVLKENELMIFGRCTWCHVWEPRKSTDPKQKDKEPEYTITLLIKKGDKQVPGILAAQEAAINYGVPKKSGGKRPPKIRPALQDGDSPTEVKGEQRGPEYAGHWFIQAKCSKEQPPDIFDKNGNPLTIAQRKQVYSGAWVWIGVNLSYYDNQSVGVGAYLSLVIKHEDDTAFGPTGLDAKRAFAAIDQTVIDQYSLDAPAANTPVANTGAAPAALGGAGAAKPWERKTTATAPPAPQAASPAAKPWERKAVAPAAAASKKPWEK